MVKRIDWVGTKRKNCKGDCIVINFNNRFSVSQLMSSFVPRATRELAIVPHFLDYFYLHRHIAFDNILQRPDNYQNLNYGYVYNIPLRNRFSILSGLDQQA